MMTNPITVTPGDDSTDLSAIIWQSMTPWLYTSQQTYVQIPGGDGLGVTYLRGRDNAVTTLTGICPRASQEAVRSLAGLSVTVSDGVTEKSGICGTPSISGQTYLMAWVQFSVTVRAEAGQ